MRSQVNGGELHGCDWNCWSLWHAQAKRQRTARTPRPGGIAGVFLSREASWSARSPLPLFAPLPRDVSVAPELHRVAARSGGAAFAGPVRVDELSARFVEALVSMGAEIVALSLQQVG